MKRKCITLLTVTPECRRDIVLALVDKDVDGAIKRLQVEHRHASTSSLLATLREIRKGLEYYTLTAKRPE